MLHGYSGLYEDLLRDLKFFICEEMFYFDVLLYLRHTKYVQFPQPKTEKENQPIEWLTIS